MDDWQGLPTTAVRLGVPALGWIVRAYMVAECAGVYCVAVLVLDVTIAAAHWWANVPLATVTREYVWEQGLADKHFSVASRASRDIPLSGYSAGDKTVACYTRRLIRQPPRPLFPGRSVTPGTFGGSLHTTS
jgi:hypothetical protein